MKRLKTQKGITLVALVITIIVLLILAVVAIGAVRDSGIIGHAQNSADRYNKGKTDEEDLLLDYDSIIESQITTIESDKEKTEPIIHNGIIPVGATYTTASGTIYNEGEEFPEVTSDGDIYIYGDYEYRYNSVWLEDWVEHSLVAGEEYLNKELSEGWGVRVIDSTKAEYETIISTINNKNVTNMVATFLGCSSLVTAPPLPDTVIEMALAFSDCSSLKGITNFPNSVTSLFGTFQNCIALEKVPTIPDTVTDMFCTFYYCKAFTTLSKLPNSIENLYEAFVKCESLTGKIEINTNPTEYNRCFADTKKEIIITGFASDETKKALSETTDAGNVKWE